MKVMASLQGDAGLHSGPGAPRASPGDLTGTPVSHCAGSCSWVGIKWGGLRIRGPSGDLRKGWRHLIGAADCRFRILLSIFQNDMLNAA